MKYSFVIQSVPKIPIYHTGYTTNFNTCHTGCPKMIQAYSTRKKTKYSFVSQGVRKIPLQWHTRCPEIKSACYTRCPKIRQAYIGSKIFINYTMCPKSSNVHFQHGVQKWIECTFVGRPRDGKKFIGYAHCPTKVFDNDQRCPGTFPIVIRKRSSSMTCA